MGEIEDVMSKLKGAEVHNAQLTSELEAAKTAVKEKEAQVSAVEERIKQTEANARAEEEAKAIAMAQKVDAEQRPPSSSSVPIEELECVKNVVVEKEKELENLRITTEELKSGLASRERAFEELDHFKDTLDAKIQSLEILLAEKENVIKIMQDQLVQMAEQNLKDLEDEAMATAPSKQVIPWSKETDEHGNIYYYNCETMESSWDPPEGYALGIDGVLRPIRGYTPA